MDLTCLTRTLGFLVAIATVVISIVTLVREIMDFNDNQPMWLVSVDHSALLDGFMAAVVLNSAVISLGVLYMLWVNHCCPAKWSAGRILAALTLLIFVGHGISVWQLRSYKGRSLAHLNDNMLASFTLKLGVTATLHYIEARFRCCGINSAEDYHNISPVPDSCCVLLEPLNSWYLPSPLDAEDWDACKREVEEYVHQIGCIGPVQDWLGQKANFLLLYNYCSVAVLGISTLVATGTAAVCGRHLVNVCYALYKLLVRALHWDVLDEWDDMCKDRCPVILHVL